MTAYEVIDQIKALPPEEKTKVEAFVQHEIEERLLAEESPEMLAAIDEADRSLAEEGGVPVEDVRRNLRQWITK